MTPRFLQSIHECCAERWDRLFVGGRRLGNPFLRHAFLAALEDTGCTDSDSGWSPRHVVLETDRDLIAAMPLFRKSHSYGEFVFDWGWAEAYARHGLEYYPKLATAAPFTPSSGPRVAVVPAADHEQAVAALIGAVQDRARRSGESSWHLLFPDAPLRKTLRRIGPEHDLLRRQDVQFHWQNRGYGSFDDFLAGFKSSRRKNLRRERRRVAEAGVTLERLTGKEIGDSQWDAFYRCYVTTYLKRSGHGGYLNEEFFHRLREELSEQLMLTVARRDGVIVGSALFLFDDECLYGRYWGALEDVPCLHFETCFYQGIEFCVERGLARFDPGTQGEHKLLRGFEPVTTCSWHWIADDRFRTAIAGFLRQERRATDAYGARARDFLPYRQADS